MDREQVDALLKDYRDNVGRCGHLRMEMKRNAFQMDQLREAFRRDALGPGVSRLTGVPRGGVPGDPTEALGLMLAEGDVPADSPEGREIQRLQMENARLAAELGVREMQVEYVDCWLAGLTDRERWVIERHIIDREIWHDIMIAFNARYTDDVSKDRLKRIQARALERIYACTV